MSKRERHDCPSCGAGLVSEPVSTPFRCSRCDWRLISRDEWQKLPPFRQGYAFYMQSSWPTSELGREKNPHAENTPAWKAFRDGEDRAARSAQDSEE